MKDFVSLFKKPAFLIAAVVALFSASLIIVISLFMGQESGNFVIQVESGNVRKSIRITDNLSNESYESRLEAGGFLEMSDTTFTRFSGKLEQYISTDGVYADEDYQVYAYTFYIVNNCEESLDLKATMFYSNVTNSLDKAIRIMTITGEEKLRRCYQAADDKVVDYGASYPSVSNFPGNGVAYEEEYLTVNPRDIIRYTIVVWIEGNDPDCVDELQRGTIKFNLKLSIL